MHHLANYFVDATLHCYILPMEQGNAPECVGALLQAVDLGWVHMITAVSVYHIPVSSGSCSLIPRPPGNEAMEAVALLRQDYANHLHHTSLIRFEQSMI